MVRIEPAKPGFDMHELVFRSTEDDKGIAMRTLRKWLYMSEEAWSCYYNDEIACAWGFYPTSMVSDRAYLWMITTGLVLEHKFIFIRHSQLVVEEALKKYSVVVGTVRHDNAKAKRWLKWLGATFPGPVFENYQGFEIRRK